MSDDCRLAMYDVISFNIIALAVFAGLFWFGRNRFEGMAYAVSESRATWSAARDTCLIDDATLAIITSPEEDTFLRERFINASHT